MEQGTAGSLNSLLFRRGELGQSENRDLGAEKLNVDLENDGGLYSSRSLAMSSSLLKEGSVTSIDFPSRLYCYLLCLFSCSQKSLSALQFLLLTLLALSFSRIRRSKRGIALKQKVLEGKI